jgi:hypothetical protein
VSFRIGEFTPILGRDRRQNTLANRQAIDSVAPD